MLPTFIIAGASKSGTTSLWEYLKAHPQVCMASIKETHFFTREAPAGRYDKGLAWYESLFQDCEGAKAIGEATPSYIIRQDAPGLIAETIPGVQLLFLLRNPVDRLYSQYWFHQQQGQRLPDFETIARSKAGDEHYPLLERYLGASSYHLHLERYLGYFPREQVSVLLNDDLRQSAPEFFRGVCQTIGVGAERAPLSIHKSYNTARRARVAWFQRLLKKLGPRLMDMELPGWLFSLLQKGRKKLWALNTSAIQYPSMQPELRKHLVEELSPAIEYVEAYLGRPLPSWRTWPNEAPE